MTVYYSRCFIHMYAHGTLPRLIERWTDGSKWKQVIEMASCFPH